jgi:hypothetical protein
MQEHQVGLVAHHDFLGHAGQKLVALVGGAEHGGPLVLEEFVGQVEDFGRGAAEHLAEFGPAHGPPEFGEVPLDFGGGGAGRPGKGGDGEAGGMGPLPDGGGLQVALVPVAPAVERGGMELGAGHDAVAVGAHAGADVGMAGIGGGGIGHDGAVGPGAGLALFMEEGGVFLQDGADIEVGAHAVEGDQHHVADLWLFRGRSPWRWGRRAATRPPKAGVIEMRDVRGVFMGGAFRLARFERATIRTDGRSVNPAMPRVGMRASGCAALGLSVRQSDRKPPRGHFGN